MNTIDNLACQPGGLPQQRSAASRTRRTGTPSRTDSDAHDGFRGQPIAANPRQFRVNPARAEADVFMSRQTATPGGWGAKRVPRAIRRSIAKRVATVTLSDVYPCLLRHSPLGTSERAA